MGGIFVSIIAGFVPIGVIAEMANIGTLSAFLVAAIGVLVLRITKPDVPRTFRCDFPEPLARELQKCKTDEDVRRVGIEWGVLSALKVDALICGGIGGGAQELLPRRGKGPA